MSLLPLWNNTFALALLLTTAVLAAACVGASRFRFSASAKNSILLPALVIAFALPVALVAARGAGWSIPLPLLSADAAAATPATSSPDPGRRPSTASTPAAAGATEARTGADDRPAQKDSPGLARATGAVAGGLLSIWAAGSLVCLVRLGRSYHSLWRLLANAHPVDHPRVAAAASEARSALGLPRYPTILATPRVSSPVAVGTPRHGWVIWPPDTLDRMPHDQLVHVLMHEGAHIAHRDTSLRVAQGLIAALWWWHPLVHLLNRQLSRAREELCDNAVLSAADPVRYGQTLLEIERPVTTPRSPALAVTLFPEHERLEHRIRNLLNPKRNTMHRSKPFVLVSACLAGVAASALAGATELTAADPEAPARGASGEAWAARDDRSLVKEYTLSFEDGSRPGHLDIDIKRGDILVTAYEGDAVLVRLSVPADTPDAAADAGGGFRDVEAQPLDFNVRQNGNVIELDANSYERTTHVEVLVPRRIDLTLDSYRAGVIRVVGVEGHVRARSQNNDITLTDIAGSADVYGYNGDFAASFREVTGELEFETYNGNIDLTLPADVRSTTYIRAERQAVRSQFAIETRPAEPVETEHEGGGRSIEFGDYVIGDINGGGARTVIETTNGAVVLRSF